MWPQYHTSWKKIQAEGKKATQENVAKFPVSPRRRIVGLSLWKTQRQKKNKLLIHTANNGTKTQQWITATFEKLNSSIKVQCISFSMIYKQKSNKTKKKKKLLIVYDCRPLRSTFFFIYKYWCRSLWVLKGWSSWIVNTCGCEKEINFVPWQPP